ncbi:MAG: hypothetical protein ACM3L6_05670 [Deltaproteobacteria bacterium]
MPSVNFESLLQKSFRRTVLILFKPFSLKKWLFLLFIAYLAGAVHTGSNGGGGGGSSHNDRSRTSRSGILTPAAYAQPAQQKPAGNFSVADFATGRVGEDRETRPDPAAEEPDPDKMWASFRQFLATPAGVIAVSAGAFVFIVLTLVLMWLGARFRFVWYDAVVNNDASVKAPFLKYAAQGDSLFGFFLALGSASLACIGLLAWWGYRGVEASGVLKQGGSPHWGTLIGALLPVILLFILLLAVLAVLALFVDHFVVTIMALEGVGFRTGWRKFTALLRQNVKNVVLFTLLVFGLSIAGAIALAIATWILIIVLLLAGGLFFGLMYLLAVALLKLKIVFVALAVLIGLPLLLAAILLLMSLSLPLAVFFRCFSLYFIGSLEGGYAPLPPEEAAPAQPQPPPAPA